jgi:hypothetical protein
MSYAAGLCPCKSVTKAAVLHVLKQLCKHRQSVIITLML